MQDRPEQARVLVDATQCRHHDEGAEDRSHSDEQPEHPQRCPQVGEPDRCVGRKEIPPDCRQGAPHLEPCPDGRALPPVVGQQCCPASPNQRGIA